jgi:dCMP deaminase
MRPSKQSMMLRIAGVVSERSTCTRAQVGAVITDIDMTNIHSIGYNGTARGLPNGCDRSTPGDCGCVHAEANALIKSPFGVDLLMFCTLTPCVSCAKLMINKGVRRVYAWKGYRSLEGIDLLRDANIPVFLSHFESFIETEGSVAGDKRIGFTEEGP